MVIHAEFRPTFNVVALLILLVGVSAGCRLFDSTDDASPSDGTDASADVATDLGADVGNRPDLDSTTDASADLENDSATEDVGTDVEMDADTCLDMGDVCGQQTCRDLGFDGGTPDCDVCGRYESGCYTCTFYVDAANGDDTAAGDSPANARRTTAGVNELFDNNLVAPGAVICFRRGQDHYVNEPLTITASGTVSQPIVIADYGESIDPPANLRGDEPSGNWMDLGNGIYTSTTQRLTEPRVGVIGDTILERASDETLNDGEFFSSGKTVWARASAGTINSVVFRSFRSIVIRGESGPVRNIVVRKVHVSNSFENLLVTGFEDAISNVVIDEVLSTDGVTGFSLTASNNPVTDVTIKNSEARRFRIGFFMNELDGNGPNVAERIVFEDSVLREPGPNGNTMVILEFGDDIAIRRNTMLGDGDQHGIRISPEQPGLNNVRVEQNYIERTENAFYVRNLSGFSASALTFDSNIVAVSAIGIAAEANTSATIRHNTFWSYNVGARIGTQATLATSSNLFQSTPGSVGINTMSDANVSAQNDHFTTSQVYRVDGSEVSFSVVQAATSELTEGANCVAVVVPQPDGFTPEQNSPCIDTGNPNVSVPSFDGTDRGPSPDRGAVERK